mmetsp:Transcript_13840/g.34896  ORF Transcript_13840/g.34896 Transcript_13840/m.34896 type:complete len:247 (-) Transcript_13840:159-899(-)
MQRSAPHSLTDHPRSLQNPRCHLAHVLQNRPRDRPFSKRQSELIAPVTLLVQRKERREVLHETAGVQKSHRQPFEKCVRTILRIKMGHFHVSGRVLQQHLRVCHLRVGRGVLQTRHHNVLHSAHNLQSIRTVLVLLHLLVRVHPLPEVRHNKCTIAAVECRLQGLLIVKIRLANLDLRQACQHLGLLRTGIAGDRNDRYALGDKRTENSPTLLTSRSKHTHARRARRSRHADRLRRELHNEHENKP